MTELALPDPSSALAVPAAAGVGLTEHASLTESGLVLSGDPTAEELYTIADKLGTVTDAACWAVGDATNLIKRNFPEHIEAFLNAGRYDEKTKKVYAAVAAFFEDVGFRDRYMRPTEGRPLSFAHFSEVRKLGMKTATYWLDRALTENLSLNQMTDLITEGLPGTDEAPVLPEQATRCQPGGFYALGEHRLIVGDSTDPQVIATLLGAERASMIWTDPPYGVDYVGKTEEALTIQNDAADDEALLRLLAGAWRAAEPHLVESAPFYVAGPTGDKAWAFLQSFRDVGWRYKQLLVWVKNRMIMGRQDHQLKHEGLFYGNAPGPNAGRMTKESYRWYGGDNITSVFEADSPSASREHPTMKPVKLIKPGLENCSLPGDIVLDLFAGSGSTMIAAEQTGRRAFMVEYDPRYADVIVTRWENYLAEQARAAPPPVIEGSAVRAELGPTAFEE